MCIAIKARIVCSKSFFPRSKNRVFVPPYIYRAGAPGRRRGRALPSRSGAAPTGRALGALAAGAPVPVRGCADGPGPWATYTVPGPRRRRGRALPSRSGLRRGPGLRAPPRRALPSRSGAAPRARALRRCAGGPPGAPVPVRAAPTARPSGRSRAGPGGVGLRRRAGPSGARVPPPAAAERWRCVGAPPAPAPGTPALRGRPRGAAGEGASVERVDEGESGAPALRADVDNGGEGEGENACGLLSATTACVSPTQKCGVVIVCIIL
ncbi:hypothetical protein EVAR_35296_1 [Eumeta japonica]|uniref:Uncharacterized protein n=1 Tax=Eumeta variegata TaxID=151549 RepID=A0A4C1XHN3_EUMVA|nr:hypothetical protein EVAR_35296_1 [Eumeta japonica]